MKDLQTIKLAVQWAKKRGFKKIKANCEDFETPTPYVRKGKEQTFVPDVTGMLRGKKSYIEIATKWNDVRRKISKWNLLSTLASIKGGKLFLIAPRGHKSFAKEVVKKHKLNAEVIYMKELT